MDGLPRPPSIARGPERLLVAARAFLANEVLAAVDRPAFGGAERYLEVLAAGRTLGGMHFAGATGATAARFKTHGVTQSLLGHNPICWGAGPAKSPKRSSLGSSGLL